MYSWYWKKMAYIGNELEAKAGHVSSSQDGTLPEINWWWYGTNVHAGMWRNTLATRDGFLGSQEGRYKWIFWLGQTGSLVVLVSSLRYLINIQIWLDEWVCPRAQCKYPEHLMDLPTYVGPENFPAKGAINKSEPLLYRPLWCLEMKSGFHTNTGYAIG